MHTASCPHICTPPRVHLCTPPRVHTCTPPVSPHICQNWPQNNPKRPKKSSKWVKTTPKRPQNAAKTMPKWSLSDPKVTLDRPKNCPKSPKSLQNYLKRILFWSQIWPYIAPDMSKMAQKGSKRGQSGQKPFKSHLHLHQIAQKHSKSTQDASRRTHILQTFVGWNVDFDRFFNQNKCFTAEMGLYFCTLRFWPFFF